MLRSLLVSSAAVVCLLISVGAAQAFIYWGQEQPYGMGIGRAGLDGSGADNGYIPGPGGTYAFTRGVAADGTDVYWGNNNPHSTTGFAPPVIGRRHLADSSDNQAFTAVTGQSVTGMAMSGGYIYYTSNSQDTSEVGRTPSIGGQQLSRSLLSSANPTRTPAVLPRTTNTSTGRIAPPTASVALSSPTSPPGESGCRR